MVAVGPAKRLDRGPRPAGVGPIGAASSTVLVAVLAVLAVVFTALLAACASAPKPTEVGGTMQAAANVNPSVSRRPSPLLVRVYELKTATAFNNADFVSLYQRDQTELGADLLARDEFTLNPGDTRPMASKVASPEARFIGVFAAYRDLDHARWRAVVPIQPGQKQRLAISAGELAIAVSVVK